MPPSEMPPFNGGSTSQSASGGGATGHVKLGMVNMAFASVLMVFVLMMVRGGVVVWWCWLCSYW